MSQQRMALWAAEEIEHDLHNVDLNLAINSYGQEYDDVQSPQIDEGTLAAMQAHMAQQNAFAQIPDEVKRFIVRFHQAVLDNNLAEITGAYESGWTRLTDKYYAKTEWPEAEIIAPLVGDDQIFLILYRELYYRHVYSRLQPNIDDRFHSYENSCELFNYLLNSDGPVPLSLPEQWLWDIIDEFIYQFQSFALFRAPSRLPSKSDDELAMLADPAAAQVWSSYSVLNVLYSLIQKSRINEWLVGVKEGKPQEEIEEIVGEYGARPLYRMLGYFSLIGLLRVHVLLGDFTLALKVLEHVDLAPSSAPASSNQSGAPQQGQLFSRVTACHVATYYYVGFCYMMLRRYPDAIRAFVGILNFITRMRGYGTRSYQYDQISKTADRMYALFSLCHALSPSRLDDSIANAARERFAELTPRLAARDAAAFEELFAHACPKFIGACGVPYDDPAALATLLAAAEAGDGKLGDDPARRHLSVFLADVRAQQGVPTLRSFLKLYTSLDARKLAGFIGGAEGEGDEEAVVQEMMAMKLVSRSVVRVNPGAGAGGYLEGEVISTSDLNFVIDENIVHIAESTVGRRYAGWFIRNTEHAQRVYDGLRAAPLPAPPSKPDDKAQAPAVMQTGGAKAGAAKVAWGAVKVGA